MKTILQNLEIETKTKLEKVKTLKASQKKVSLFLEIKQDMATIDYLNGFINYTTEMSKDKEKRDNAKMWKLSNLVKAQLVKACYESKPLILNGLQMLVFLNIKYLLDDFKIEIDITTNEIKPTVNYCDLSNSEIMRANDLLSLDMPLNKKDNRADSEYNNIMLEIESLAKSIGANYIAQ